VVGSTSHFSVLFGDERCLKESQSDVLLERCRRAFKKVEGGGENGYISVDKLGKVLAELELRTTVGGDSGVQTLQAYLEVSGAGIILWDDFWKASSRLMTGSSLEMVMTSRHEQMQGSDTNNGNASAATAPPQSDEELAKRLAAEWGSNAVTFNNNTGGAAAKSDEDYARELQAQWDAEEGGGTSAPEVVDLTSSVATAADDSVRHAAAGAAGPVADGRDGKVVTRSTDFEKHGDSFPLYHYNGLREGTLTPFRLTRLSPAEAVGASVALTAKGGAGHGGSVGGDLEDVVRTKWPSSMLDWHGKAPPSID